MRSPPGARFPSRCAALLASFVLTACTGGSEPLRDQPTPSVSPAPTEVSGSTGGTGIDTSKGEVAGTGIADKDSKRTVRGQAPLYVEIEEAAIEGSVDELRLRLILAGGVPKRMPDRESILRVSFTLTMKDGRKYTFDAQCVRPGWGTFASGGPEDAPIPELSIEGPRLELIVDPAYIGGLQPFEWLVNVAWTSGEANYAFDAAPKQGLASFP